MSICPQEAERRRLVREDRVLLETQLLDWIGREPTPISTTEVLAKYQPQTPGLTGERLRQAVWTLVDRHKLVYGLDWRLRLADTK